MGECCSSRPEPSRARSVNWRGAQDKDGGACPDAPRTSSRRQYRRPPTSLRNSQDHFGPIVPEAGRGPLRGSAPVRTPRYATRFGGPVGSTAWQCVPDGQVDGTERQCGCGRRIRGAYKARARGGRRGAAAQPRPAEKRLQSALSRKVAVDSDRGTCGARS
jgi:hypothetical protein